MVTGRHTLLQAEVLLLKGLVVIRESLERLGERGHRVYELVALCVDRRELPSEVRGGGGDVAGLLRLRWGLGVPSPVVGELGHRVTGLHRDGGGP